MKTKELIEKLKNFELTCEEEGLHLIVRDKWNNNFFTINFYKREYVGISTEPNLYIIGRYFKALEYVLEYMRTPVSEREEEKKYCFRVLFHDYAYLNFYKGSYVFAGKIQEAGYQTKFTQKEIDAMPFDTSFFVKEEVK